MRSLTRILPLAVLLLPGCVLAIGGGDGDGHKRGPQPLEQRVAELERRVHDMEQCMSSCSMECCKGGKMDMHGDGEEGEEHEGHEGHAPPPPPMGGPH
jgi:hypothetical protein